MMDFDGKDSIIQKIQENADLQQRLIEWQQLALALADRYDPVMGEGLAQQILQEGGQAVPQLPHMGQVRRLRRGAGAEDRGECAQKVGRKHAAGIRTDDCGGTFWRDYFCRGVG